MVFFSEHSSLILVTEDYNGFQQEGFGPADRTIWKGSRWSAANAYLKPALKTKKLMVMVSLWRIQKES